MPQLARIMNGLGFSLDLVGILTIVLGAAIALVRYFRQFRSDPAARYRELRHSIGRAILLGLEFLVGGDIIRSVAISPTFAGVGVLAVIVLIRTFLSFSLELEIEGRFPWQKGNEAEGPKAL